MQANSLRTQLIPQKDPWYMSYLYIVYIVISVIYLIWRFIYTLNWSTWFSFLIYACDIYIVTTTIIFLITSRKIFVPQWHKPKKKFTVDIFIPTYNEPAEIVEITTIAALNVVGVHKVFVLDDGNRSNIKKLIQDTGAVYLARGKNLHAKAGNLNFGLHYSQSDLILNIDCDHVPSANFIERTVGYFDDPEIAFIQTPQVFYNDDSIQHRKTHMRNLWNEQTMFYESIQPAKNGFNAAFFCGSGALIRRSALDSVGGYATQTATEDIHTSIRLHAKGWKSLFVPEKLAFGLAAEDISEYHKQRVRWGAGSLGLLFRSSDSPLVIKGLSIMQRLCYFYSTIAYLYGVQKIIYFFAPILTLFSLTHPKIPLIYYFSFYLPFMLFSYVITYIYSRRTFHIPYTEQYDILNIFSNVEALKGIIRVQKKFGVSIKMKPIKERSIVYYTLLFLALIMIISNVYAVFQLSTQSNTIPNLFSSTIFVGIFWNSFNLFFVLSTISFLNDYYVKEKNIYKFKVDQQSTIEPDDITARVVSMSLSGAILHTDKMITSKKIKFGVMTDSDECQIESEIKKIKNKRSHYELVVTFPSLTKKQKKELVIFFINHSVKKLFSNDFNKESEKLASPLLNLRIDSNVKL